MRQAMQRILSEFDTGRDCVWAMIVTAGGSTPRGVGSQMLVGENGRLCGTIGGGAVEGRSIEQAQRLVSEHRSLRRDFVLHPAPGSIGMVCGGDVSVWFQFLSHEDAALRAAIETALENLGKSLEGCLKFDLSEASVAYAPGRAAACASDGCFLLPVPVGERVLVFGAGHVSRALVPLLCTVGFRPTVYDSRAEFVTREAFPDAARLVCADFEKIYGNIDYSPDDYAVVMTSGHGYDFEVQRQLLTRDYAYVGVIGSASKKAAVNARLREAGISEEKLAFVHTPIGMRIRAVTPEEIAVSIAGEMILVRAERRDAAGTAHAACPMHGSGA